MTISKISPHVIALEDPETGEIRKDFPILATVHPASPEAVARVLTSSTDGNGRSEPVWVTLSNGGLILGVFPQGDMCELMRQSDARPPEWNCGMCGHLFAQPAPTEGSPKSLRCPNCESDQIKMTFKDDAPRFIVVGREKDNPGSRHGHNGKFPPFMIFDTVAQDDVPDGLFYLRDQAEPVAEKLNAGKPAFMGYCGKGSNRYAAHAQPDGSVEKRPLKREA